MGRNRTQRPRQSRLTTIISFAYEMNEDDVAELADDILKARAAAWRSEVQNRASSYGATIVANPPSGDELNYLRQQSLQDARSIRDTWNQQVRNEVNRLYNQNPKGNRNYYKKNMQTMATRRDEYKARQIALNTEQTAKTTAREDFERVNNLQGGKYRYSGPAPVGPICKRRFKLGVVDQNTRDSEPIPAHPNCPHDWEQVEPPALPAGVQPNELWVG